VITGKALIVDATLLSPGDMLIRVLLAEICQKSPCVWL